ncbi:DUF3006 domain-containing protein [Bacillus sp. CECT 9360]|uniref:DUF3006 domain-containing protein n=1 Tax=Bacillus sp. CECT 9360 TaxID=2845821 RepID=UPI001E343F93|nr:DUF3006 domain-containing protein [Bacillus sp. CECT 9360]CAH0345725.1 hypothetical protein BCI9360_02023 [Bacillus sp. CECT 9360]
MLEVTKGVIDRFEGSIAVVEVAGETVDFPKDIFPKEAKAGDVVEISGDNVKVLNSETEKLRKEIEDLMDEVWED